MKTSRCISWNPSRKFGFIQNPDPCLPDLFCHASSLIGRARLIPGETVSFEESSNEKGLVAVRVEVVDVPISTAYAVAVETTAFDSQYSVNAIAANARAVQPVTFNATGNLTTKEVTSNEFTK